ncbi:MAG: hypothetical protein IEMM0008_1344 [bacterium]|nr:MAG: hypothetical protein IEMM0008_1344 [bacterium]
MRNKTKWILFSITLFNIGLLSLTVYAASGWLIKIDNETVFNIEDFEEEFIVSVETQALSDPVISLSKIRKAKKDKKAKCTHLVKVRDELIVVKDAEDKGILDKSKLKKQVKIMAGVIRRNLISQLYIRDVIAKKAKNPDKKNIKDIYNRLNQDKRYKKLPATQKMKIAKEEARRQLLQKKIAFTLTELRSRHRIKTSDYADSLCE